MKNILTKVLQNIYLNKVILNSKKSYITYNEIIPKEFNSYKSKKRLETILDSKRVKEIPLTHPNNCIIVWGGWLNNNQKKIVVAPKQWGSHNSNANTVDQLPESWSKL